MIIPEAGAGRLPLLWGPWGRLFVLPLGVSLLCYAVAWVLPADRVWTNVTQALLLSAPRWLLLAWPVGALWLGWRTRRPGPALGLGLAGLVLAGVPLPRTAGLGRVLVSANSQAYSEDVEELEVALAALEADVLIAIERRAEAVPGLVRVADNFDRPIPKSSHGLAVFCRPVVACEAVITEEFGSATQQMPLALVRFDGVCVLGVHGPPPAPRKASGLGPYVRRVAEAIGEGRLVRDWGPCRVGDPAVVVGDLNAVPGSGPHRVLLGRGLEDTLAWHGVWASTWPAGGGWPDLPVLRLDHLLTREVPVEGLGVVRLPGADHKALRARLRTDVILRSKEERR